jgi:hypothetical protein
VDITENLTVLVLMFLKIEQKAGIIIILEVNTQEEKNNGRSIKK